MSNDRLKPEQLAAIIHYSATGLLEEKYVKMLIAEIRLLQSDAAEALDASAAAIERTVELSNRVTELEAENKRLRVIEDKYNFSIYLNKNGGTPCN